MALAIAGEVLRWLPDLDVLIDAKTAQVLPDDSKARMVLRMMAAQWLRLETPPHAVIAANLPLLAGGPRRLAHGVFGALVRGEAKLAEFPSLPADTAGRWTLAWDDAVVVAASRLLAEPPPLDLMIGEGRTPDLPEGKSLAPRHLRLARGQAVERLPGFDVGDWWVQDLAASIAARLLGSGEGRSVLDLCAAPGGKTMQLADAGWRVTAVDRSEQRLRRLSRNLERCGLSAEVVTANLLDWQPEGQVDAVLLDAPCSATGTFRRHPDVLHRIGARQIAELAELQARLLDRAADWVKPGGTLVYATCSLEPAEGEQQMSAFLGRHSDFALAPVRTDELPDGMEPTGEGWVRTLPTMLTDRGGLDGFFIARLVRQT